jgi:hypothetical protein
VFRPTNPPAWFSKTRYGSTRAEEIPMRRFLNNLFRDFRTTNSARDSRRAPRSATLQVEALENRFMPSASASVVPPVHAAPAEQVADMQPNFNIFHGGDYVPNEIRGAYGFSGAYGVNLTGLDGTGQTIAIVDAFDEPNIAYDLQVFDKQFGLPAPPQFTEYKEHANLAFEFAGNNAPGYGPGPSYNSNWEVETALDVEWAHAIAPGANILLVETLDNTHLYDGVSFASNYTGVSVVSMSWGAPEYAGETGNDGLFTTPQGHSPVTFVAATGDSGGERLYPAVSPNVLAVGGTTLNLSDSGTYGSETAWSKGGGGVSAFETEPAFQRPFQGYGQRTVPDVAYDADPGTGFAVYVHSQDGFLSTPWGKVGGTSAGTPQWAGLIALANQGRAKNGLAPLANAVQDIYGIPSASFHDITSGNNGHWAHQGYDLATGLGTPKAAQIISALINVERPVYHVGGVYHVVTGGAINLPTQPPVGVFVGRGSTLIFAPASSNLPTNQGPVGWTTPILAAESGSHTATGVTDKPTVALGATVDSFAGLKPDLATLLAKAHAEAGVRLWKDEGFRLGDGTCFAD